MPALRFAPGVIRVVQQGSYGGVNCANVFHVTSNGSLVYSLNDVQAAANGVRAAYVAQFQSFMSTQATIGNCVAQDLSSDVGAFAVATGATAGTDAATPGPANIALCLSWKTARHFRGGHARTYLFGLTTNGPLNPNTFNTTIVSNASTKGLAFLNAVNAINYPDAAGHAVIGMLSRVQNKVVLATPVLYPWTSVTVDNRIDTQRRRLGRDR
jgi:hypothetical protein